MKSRALVMALAVAVATVAPCLAQQPASGSPPEIDINGGFEHGSGDIPTGWDRTESTYELNRSEFAKHARYRLDDDMVHSGRWSISVEMLETFPRKCCAPAWSTFTDRLEEKRSYRFSIWVRVRDSQTRVTFNYRCLRQNRTLAARDAAGGQRSIPMGGTVLRYQRGGVDLDPGKWHEVAFEIDAPKGTNMTTIMIGISTPVSLGKKAWFDDARLVAVP